MAADLSIASGAELAASSLPLSKFSKNAVNGDPSFGEAFQAAQNEKDTPEKIAGAAKQFEALMVGQILRTARETSGGGWLTEEDSQDDQSGSLVMDLAEQGLSQAIAAHGGLGIAKMVTKSLERGHSKTPSSDSQDSPLHSLKSTERPSKAPHTSLSR